MASLKETIPDAVTLEKIITELSISRLSIFLSETKEERGVIIKNRRYFIVAMALIFCPFLFSELLPFWLVSLTIISIGIAMLFFVRRWDKSQRDLAQKHNKALVPIISACLGYLVTYSHEDTNNIEAKMILKESKLLTETYDTVRLDDVYVIGKEKVRVRELAVTNEESYGKSRSTVFVFKGLLIVATLEKSLDGSTFISTEGDKNGFAHKDFMSSLFDNNKIKETQLEWNEFERDLHVATDNEVEARYILNPAIMESLHRGWRLSRENIRIVFKGDKMYMLLPNDKVIFNNSTISLDAKELNKYAFSVIEPLWRTLTLVEDIRV
jgi:hypothetical protein